MSQPHDQQELPFAQLEGSRAERKNLLGLALLKSNANIYLAQLMVWIFNTTDGGNPLKKSYDELASRPWGLCCSNSQARATVRQAKRLRILRVVETWAGPGIQAANEYAIDWGGVRQIVFGRQADTGVTTWQPGVSTKHPGVTTEHPGVTYEHPIIKEYTSSPFLSPSTPSCAGARQPEGAAGGVVLEEAAAAPVLAGTDWRPIKRRLAELGVYADLIEKIVHQAARNEATPDDVAALADHFESKPQAWTAGALALAVKRWTPAQSYDAESLWPPPSEAYRKQAQRVAAERQRREADAEHLTAQREAEQTRAHLAEQEARLGPVLDALEDAAIAELAATHWIARDLLSKQAARPTIGLLRSMLLDALEKRQLQTQETKPC
jgi:hypothetical protein